MQLPVVTMVTDSHGACVVQPMSAGLGVWGANCARRGKRGGVSFFSIFLVKVPPLSVARQRRSLCKLCFNDSGSKKMWSSYIKYFIFANVAYNTGIVKKRHSHLVIIPKDLQQFSSLDE